MFYLYPMCSIYILHILFISQISYLYPACSIYICVFLYLAAPERLQQEHGGGGVCEERSVGQEYRSTVGRGKLGKYREINSTHY